MLIINGTDRESNLTQIFCEYYGTLFKNIKILSIIDNELEKNIKEEKNIIIVMPEYNGSFPGILKLKIDSFDPNIWAGKNIMMSGVSSGRAGNLRGMDHLTGILHYLRANIFHLKLPISNINSLIKDRELVNPSAKIAMEDQANKFEVFCNLKP